MASDRRCLTFAFTHYHGVDRFLVIHKFVLGRKKQRRTRQLSLALFNVSEVSWQISYTETGLRLGAAVEQDRTGKNYYLMGLNRQEKIVQEHACCISIMLGWRAHPIGFFLSEFNLKKERRFSEREK